MAKQAEGGASTVQEQEIAKLKRERDTLKSQLSSTKVRPKQEVQFTTTNMAEATTYERAGGHLESITKLYPGSNRSGKRFGFIETKEQLDALVKKAQEEGLV